ncbi:MAG: flagellar motor stator protein MotA [Rhodospirillaceae bacterium]|nr:flagellar motor stator protein MotA [Rhodospirillaceae bacterium]MCA8932876.1 flagellar motor stator protein MotA [Rhodospirillaceae bacterium]
MLLIVGALVVILCTLGGYTALGGHLAVLVQPFEVVIIVGSAIGAYIIANPKNVLSKTGKALGMALGGKRYSKEQYLELLSLLYQLFKVAKTKGMLTLEQHIEKPDTSSIFQQFPGIYQNPVALTFICDYLRLMSLGSEDPHTLEDLMDEEIETAHEESLQVSTALQTMADAMPALGIVAAVLGVIKTMGAITEPPEVLGHLIGGALVGTFLGVWISYGFLAPIASSLKAMSDAQIKYFQCIKAGLLAHLHGYAPAVSIEFARKVLFSEVRPDFYEVEETTQALPPAA